MLYIFGDQAGAIPGIPGTFAHCTVEVDDEGNAHVISPTPVVGEAVQGDAQEEVPAQEETIVQEQDAQSADAAESAVQPIVSMGG